MQLQVDTVTAPESACPKQMTHGPCGGVRTGGSCEVPDVACPFVALDQPVRWQGVTADSGGEPAVPRLVVDFRPDPTMEWELRDAVELLRRAGVWALIGEHVDDVTPHEPAAVARAVTEHGLNVISTLVCRGRSREDLRAQLDQLAELPGVVVHCVTGDHPRARLGLDDDPWFDLDSLELAALARSKGVTVSVAESPAAAPAHWRPQRLAEKQAAGAQFAVLNHAGSVAELTAFADACRTVGVDIPIVAPVPVVTDKRSLDALMRFPGLELPDELGPRVLDAADPEREGIRYAAEMGSRLLESKRFGGINLSGAASAGDIVHRAEIMARVAEGVR